jgi:uncharacterized protein (TIGR02266 family)
MTTVPNQTGSNNSTGGILVYLLDPDHSFGQKLYTELSKFGIRVRLFDVASRCVDNIKRESPQVLIGSFQSFHHQGHMAAELLADNLISLPFIGYTSETDAGQIELVMAQNNLAALLSMPFKIHDLLTMIKQKVDSFGAPAPVAQAAPQPTAAQPAVAPAKPPLFAPPTPTAPPVQPVAPPPVQQPAGPAAATRDPFVIREHVRVPVKISVTIASENDLLNMWARNISRGGIFIETPFPFPRGKELKLHMDLPVIDNYITVDGQVAFVKDPDRLKPGEHPGMGVKFIKPTAQQLEPVEELLDLIARKPKRVIEKSPETISRYMMLCSQTDIFSDLKKDLKSFMKHVDVGHADFASEVMSKITTHRPEIILCDIASVPDYPIFIGEKKGSLFRLPVLLVSPELELEVVMDLLTKVDDVIQLPTGMTALVDNLKAFFTLHQRTTPRLYCEYKTVVGYGGLTSRATLRAISTAGGMVFTPEDDVIGAGTPISLEVLIPELDAPLMLAGDVVNTIYNHRGTNRYGIRLRGADSFQQERLNEFVQKKLHTIQYLRWTYYPL